MPFLLPERPGVLFRNGALSLDGDGRCVRPYGAATGVEYIEEYVNFVAQETLKLK